MKTRRRSHRGAATSPARWLTGATCRGRPRRRLPATPKCRHRGGHRRLRATRMLARARDKQLALLERTSERSALAWRPARRAPPSRREPRPAKLTPRGGRRNDRLPYANFTMAPTARLGLPAEVSVTGEVVGLDIDTGHTAGGGIWCCSAVPAVATYSGRQSPGRPCLPHHRRGPRTNPGRHIGPRINPRADGGVCCHR
jgi:hypothetical protein